MVTEMRTSRVRRTWLDKLLLWQRAYETRIFDGHHEVIGRGPTPEASQAAAEGVQAAIGAGGTAFESGAIIDITGVAGGSLA